MQGLVRTGWSVAELGHLSAAPLLDAILTRVAVLGVDQVRRAAHSF
jgi:hypothetical protein